MDQRLALIEPVETYQGSRVRRGDRGGFERMRRKKEVFARLEAVMKPGAMLLTNRRRSTSSDGQPTRRPQDVAGAHFFAPANVMKTVRSRKGTRRRRDTMPQP